MDSRHEQPTRSEPNSRSSQEERSVERETENTRDIFDLAEGPADLGSDTSILRRQEMLEEPDMVPEESSSQSRQFSASSGPEKEEEIAEELELASSAGEEFLELPEDELPDIPVSQDYRLVSTTDSLKEKQSVRPEASAEPPTAEVSPIEAEEEDSEARKSFQDSDVTTATVVPDEESALAAPGAPETEPGEESEVLSESLSEEKSLGHEEAATAAAMQEEESPQVLMVRFPDAEQWIPLSDLIVQQTGQPLGMAAARWITRLYLQSLRAEDHDVETKDFEQGGQAEETLTFAEPPGELMAFPKFETGEGALDYRERVRKGKPQKSILKEIVGIVLGGLGGLLIAYYALNFFGGKQYDFANIPLPGIPHTYHHVPDWAKTWLGRVFSTSQPSDQGQAQSTPESP